MVSAITLNAYWDRVIPGMEERARFRIECSDEFIERVQHMASACALLDLTAVEFHIDPFKCVWQRQDFKMWPDSFVWADTHAHVTQDNITFHTFTSIERARLESQTVDLAHFLTLYKEKKK